MAGLYYTGACLCLIGIIGANAESDPILDRLARLKSNFAHMHHRHRDAPPPQDDEPAPQMSFSQAPAQAPHLDLSVLGPPPQQMMDGNYAPPQGNYAPPQLSMGQMNAPQPSFEAPQANFAPPAPQDDEEAAPRMEEGRRDDDDDAGSAGESPAVKSDPIVQKLALLKSNFKRMHGSHRLQRNMDTQSMDQNSQAQNFRSDQATEGGNNGGDFQRPLDQAAPEGEQPDQPNPAPVALVDAPSALDMSTPTYGSHKPLSQRKTVFGLKMPDVDQPQEEDDQPPAGPAPQANFVQGQEDDNQQGPVDEEPPQPRPQRSGSFDRQSDPIIARLSRFRDNIEQIKNSKSLSGGRGRQQRQEALPQESQETDDQVAQQNGMTAFANYRPDAAPESDAQDPQDPPVAENSRFQGFQSKFNKREKPSMSAAEVIAKLQMEGNAQLQAEFHPQSALGAGIMPNVLPGVQPDLQRQDNYEAGAQQRTDGMEGEDMDRQEGPPMRTRKRMNLWAQSQQQDQGAPVQQQQFLQQPDLQRQEDIRNYEAGAQQQGPGFGDQSPEQEAPMQRQSLWGQQGGQAAFNQMQGQSDSDQDREQPADQGPVDNEGPRQDDMEEGRPAPSRQRDDPIADKLQMLQNNFKRIRDHAHIQKKLISENQDLESGSDSGNQDAESRSDSSAGNQEQNSDSSDGNDSEAQQPQGDGPEQDSQADNDSADQNSMPPQASPDSDQDQDAMPMRGMNAPHKWSLLQGQSTSSQGDVAQSSRDLAQSSHAALAQFTKAQAAVDPEVAAADKSIDAQVAEAESVGPSSAITDLISKHSHQHIDDKLAMIQENFENMKNMRRR